MNKIQFDPNEEGGLELVRIIVFQRLQLDNNWSQYDISGEGFNNYVEYVGNPIEGRRRLTFLVQEIMWEFMSQGILAPGLNYSNPNLPFFHITEYGRKVLEEGEIVPHDPTGYLQKFKTIVTVRDSTIEVYLAESLNCFTRGNMVASVVMLGVSSERVFMLLCDALLNSLSNAREKKKFDKIVKAKAIKPKMDWVHSKIQSIQSVKPSPLPENVNIMLAAIFDFIRCQRNDLGHPRDIPPKVII